MVGNGDDADVGVDGAERVVCGLRLSGACDGVEKGGFTDVGETDNTSGEHEMRGLRGRRYAAGGGGESEMGRRGGGRGAMFFWRRRLGVAMQGYVARGF